MPGNCKKRRKEPAKLVVLADNRVKLKETPKRDKYLHLARELKEKLLNLKMKVIRTVFGAFRTIPKD